MLTQRQLLKDGKRSVVMPFQKLLAFHREFPWIREHIGFKGQQFYVSVVTSELLSYQLAAEEEFRPPRFLGPGFSHEKMYFLDENGRLVVGQERLVIPMRRFIFFGPVVKRRWNPKTKGKADEISPLRRVVRGLGDDIARVRYVLSYFRYTDAVIIYKVPKDLDLKQTAVEHLSHEAEIPGLGEFQVA